MSNLSVTCSKIVQLLLNGHDKYVKKPVGALSVLFSGDSYIGMGVLTCIYYLIRWRYLAFYSGGSYT